MVGLTYIPQATNDLALAERDVLAFVLPHQLIVHIPECLCFGVNGLPFELVQMCLNGCLQHLLGRLRLIGRQTLDLLHQTWFSQFNGHDSPPSVFSYSPASR